MILIVPCVIKSLKSLPLLSWLPETGLVILHCPFARQVRLAISNWTAGVVPVPDDLEEGVEEWWKRSLELLPAARSVQLQPF